MVFKNKIINRFWRFSCSFELGIPVMVSIAVLTAWGTFVEAGYDAYAAKKIVYGSWMMWLSLALLVYNLIVVVIDRWPWQLRHYPFITVHAGMIILIFGSYITYRYGLDGQMSVNINGKNNLVSVPETDLVVYATFDGDRYSKIVDREVDFFSRPPSADKPYKLELGNDEISIVDYIKYARLQNKVKPSADPGAGASIRFQLMNANVKQVQQITQPKKDKMASYNLGPAKVHLGTAPEKLESANEIFLTPHDQDSVRYVIFHKNSPTPFKTGKLRIGEVLGTGWMGLEFRLLDYLPLAMEEYEVLPLERPTPLTVAAVKVRHKDSERWLALNDVLKLFSDSSAYILSYQNRRLDLGFELQLEKFEVQRYQGTIKAMEYSSQVTARQSEIAQSAVISMNEPLKFNGYTIYQASFQEDEVTGEPVASVFSINRDPGRWIKYLGSLIFSLGIVWLFYQRRKRATAV